MVTKKTAEASKSTLKQDAAGRRVGKKGEPRFANYTEKAIPLRIQEYCDWLERETGYSVDPRSVYLGSSLRGTFQKSDENQERIAERAKEIEQEKIDRAAAREQRKADIEQRKVERAERAAAREAAKAEKAAEAKPAPKAKAAPKAAARKSVPSPKAKAAPATTRRRPARAAKADAEEADF